MLLFFVFIMVFVDNDEICAADQCLEVVEGAGNLVFSLHECVRVKRLSCLPVLL